MRATGSRHAIDRIKLRCRGRLAALAIAAVPVTALVGCAAAADTDAGFSDPGYFDPEYSDPGYFDPEYSDPGYFDPEYSDPEYSDPEYSDPEYSDPGYSDFGGMDVCAFPGDPICEETPIKVPPPNLGPAGGW
jgi:hypothetical protein